MVNKGKDGEEALKKILLRMSYDLGKTLNENKSLLKESPTIKNNTQSSLNQNINNNIFGGYNSQYQKDRNMLIKLYKDKPFPFERPQEKYRPETYADRMAHINPRDNTAYNPTNIYGNLQNNKFNSPTKITGKYYLYRGKEMSVDEAMNQYKKDKEDWLSVNYGPSPYPGYFKHAFRGEDNDDKKEKQDALLSRIEKYMSYDDYLNDINNPKNHTYDYDGMEEDLKKMGSYVKDYINYMSNDPDIALVQEVKKELEYRKKIADNESKRQCDEYIVKQTNNSNGNKKLSQQEQDNLFAWLKTQPGFENATGFAGSSTKTDEPWLNKDYLLKTLANKPKGHHTNLPKSAVIDVTQKTRDGLNAAAACSRIQQELYDELGVTELQKIVDSLGSDLKNHEEYLEALENQSTHMILGFAAMGLTIIGMMAQAVTGGAATPLIGGLTLRGMSFAAGALVGGADAALYASEGNTRMAIFVGLLSAFDASAVAGSLKSIRATSAEVQALGDKFIKLINSKRIGTTTLQKEFTKRELEILATAGKNDANALRILRGEAKILSKESLKLAAKELAIFSTKSVPYFVSSLLKFKTYLDLTGLFLVMDGIQISYNELYNALSGKDEELKSLTLLLIDNYFNDSNVKSQIDANNLRLELQINQLNNVDSVEFLSSVIGLDFGGEVNVKGDLSIKAMAERFSKIPVKILDRKEKKLLPGAVKTFNNVTGTVPFKTQEEGNKFREWFNTEFPTISKSIDLSKTGPFNNSHIKRAYNIPVKGRGTIGDIYNEEMSNMDNSSDNKPVSGNFD